jgi:hypothetical protein
VIVHGNGFTLITTTLSMIPLLIAGPSTMKRVMFMVCWMVMGLQIALLKASCTTFGMDARTAARLQPLMTCRRSSMLATSPKIALAFETTHPMPLLSYYKEKHPCSAIAFLVQ